MPVQPNHADASTMNPQTLELMQNILGSINSGISAVTIDAHNRLHFVFANTQYYSLLGYTKHQFETEVEDAFDLLHPEDRSRIEQTVQQVIRDCRPATYEYRVIRRDGTPCFLRCNASITSLEGVDDRVLLSVLTDVTAFNQAEQHVAQSAAQLKAITDNINGGVTATIIRDRTAHFLFSNDQYYAQLGYTREQYRQEISDAFSLVHPDDRERVIAEAQRASNNNLPYTITYRILRRDGVIRWIQSNISMTNFPLVAEAVQLAVANDITEQKEAEDRLRMSEEQYRIAASTGGRRIARYDISTGVYHHDDALLYAMGYGAVIQNVPQTFIDSGFVAPECAEAYDSFYARIRMGEKVVGADAALRLPDGSYRWFHGEATVIFDAGGRPSQAIIVSLDIMEQREKEAVYKKWQQSLQQKPVESYSLFRANLNQNALPALAEGSLLQYAPPCGACTFDAWARAYADTYVYYEDRTTFRAFLDSDALLRKHHHGKRLEMYEFREALLDGGLRWLRLTVELVEYPNASDIEAYLMFEDINASKQAQLLAKKRADLDPLTGVLNRAIFAQEVNAILAKNRASQHALLMLDIDGFKHLNDTLGHAAGDQALIDVAIALRSILRRSDLAGRLGGDEFLVFLENVPYDAVIRKKATQICALMRKSFSPEVQISASVGIAVYPRDGIDYESLYRSADTALYSVKNAGRNNFAYSNRPSSSDSPGDAAPETRADKQPRKRVLIVDRNANDRNTLASILQETYLIETAANNAIALIRLRHYGAGLSVVLLRLSQEDSTGYSLLEQMHETLEISTIPVVVIGEKDGSEAALKAIALGALDYIATPVDAASLRLRVQAVIGRSENERQRAQNSYQLLQSSDENKYRTVLESTGTVVIEYDWINGVYSYDPSISRYIAGQYDARKLWHILLSDMVASVMEIKKMQDLVHQIANDRRSGQSSMLVQLKTPSQQKHWFRLNVFKRPDAFQLTDKMILTFIDVNEEVLSSERLRLQAERDPLTGLLNRQTFLQKVEATVRESPADTYLMAVGDIDNFKIVNDRFGYSEGDALLRFIANALQTDVSRVGGLCGRLGNDVFAVLLPYASFVPQQAVDYPKALLGRYRLDLEATCSVGLYLVDMPEMHAGGILDRAVMAKQTVKGKYDIKTAWYDETLRKKLLLEQEITGAMESALANGLFDIYLQPQYNHVTGEICGVESLARWLHPEQGVHYYPNSFIPLFERNGFIAKLDEFIWNRTAALLHQWLSNGGKAIPVSVNVSRLDTHDPMLCHKLLAILEKHHIPIDLFRLEITESLFEADASRLIGVIDTLHSAGFLIEMDDFGSGYSSLNILKDVPVDILKLDMRFFSGHRNANRSGVILSAIMRMARWLGISVIAEGVETLAQADFLASVGCPIVQGYLYAKPMPVEAFEQLLLRNAVLSPVQAEPHTTQQLWSLDAFDSELFYRHIGAAVIFEYQGGRFEAMRANEHFYRLIQCSTADPLPTHAPLGMHEDDIPFFYAATERAIDSYREETVDIRRVFQGRADILPLRCTLRMLTSDKKNALLLCSISPR